MIDDNTLNSIFYLSRLKVSEKEKEEFRTQTADIIYYFDLLNNHNTEDVDPDLGESITVSELREDEVIKGFNRETFLSFAICVKEGFFSVPKILENSLDNKKVKEE